MQQRVARRPAPPAHASPADEELAAAERTRRRRESARGFFGTRDALWSGGCQLRLHTFDGGGGGAYVETKIGGHALDHRRFVSTDWSGTALSTRAPQAPTSLAALLSSRASPAFAAAKHDVLVYAATKIGGHALDHVPFIDRGQPSRPLLGFVPSVSPALLAGLRHPAALPVPPLVGIGRHPSNLYDCSRCLRVRQSPRVQLSCGHPVCAACVSSRFMVHAEAGGFCFLQCARCHELIAIEAIVFSSQYALRINAPAVRTLEEFMRLSNSNDTEYRLTGSSSLSVSGWKYGGIVAVLAVATKMLQPHRRKLKQAGEVDPADNAILDDVAALTLPRAADGSPVAVSVGPLAVKAVVDGAARWKKRVAGLRPPSKLLKYDFVRTLGVGNFAEVMLVKRRSANRNESRSDLLLSVLKESDRLQEAVNEIQLLSKIRSPHVVRIYRYFIEEVGHRQFAYIDMEYCDRGDLMQLLQQQGPLDGATFDSYFRQLCLGLHEIHAHGVVHRDLKPGNVLLTSEGVAKIADFGVSTWLESDLHTHHAAGTVAFMAPEVRRYFLGEDVSYDGRADIWSLGALAYAMLIGDPEPRVATRPLEELVEDLRERGVQDKYVELMERTLQPAPSERASVTELLALFPAMNAKL